MFDHSSCSSHPHTDYGTVVLLVAALAGRPVRRDPVGLAAVDRPRGLRPDRLPKVGRRPRAPQAQHHQRPQNRKVTRHGPGKANIL